MKISGFMSSVKQAFLPLILVALGAHGAVSAGTVVVTPGSLAGYTYFPKAESSGGGSSGSGTDNVGTLQRCFWTPPAGDHTVNLSNSNWYDYGDTRPITFYYKMAGGNGGVNYSGGGGGSSAILKNGTEVKVAPGGNGGNGTYGAGNQMSPTQEGSFTATKSDILRFVTGGGGGDGAVYAGYGYYYSFVGGGGGAGYMGGGGGASSSVGSMLPAVADVQLVNMGGKGGSTTPGAGGVPYNGTQYGTAGNGMNGGVSTYPDGNSAPVGTAPTGMQSYTYYCDVSGPCYGQYRFPAKPGINGSHAMPLFYSSGSMIGIGAGGGGAVGYSGTGVAYITYDSYRSGMMWTSPGTPSSGGNYTSLNAFGTSINYYPAPTTLNLTRTPRTDVGGTVGGGLSGQIVLMYQAPVCSILK